VYTFQMVRWLAVVIKWQTADTDMSAYVVCRLVDVGGNWVFK
jgi:hypothetical protein